MYENIIFFSILILLSIFYSIKKNKISWILLLIYFVCFYVFYTLGKVDLWVIIIGCIFLFQLYVIKENKRKPSIYDILQVCYVLIAFFSIYYTTNNMYMNISSIILFTIGLYVLTTKNRDRNFFLFVLFLLILLISVSIINYYFFKKENFYTLFEPNYFDKKTYKNTPKDALLTYNNNNYYTNTINVSYLNNQDKKLTDILGKLILSRTKIVNLNLTNSNKLNDLIILPSPQIKNYDNIEFIGNLSHRYLYCISSIKSGIQFIQQLENKKLGIPDYLLPIWNDIFPYIFDKKINVIVKNKEELAKDLKNNSIDAIFYCDRHGNKYVSDIIKSTISTSFQLVPFVFNEGNNFIKNNPSYKKSILKLTTDYLPSKYLPIGFGRIWNNNYMPEYWTYSYDVSLFSRNNFNKNLGYQITKTIITGREIITKNNSFNINDYIYSTMTPADVALLLYPNIHFNKGAKEYYTKLGLITDCKDPKCMLKIGTGKCNVCKTGNSTMIYNTDSIIRKIESKF